MGSLAQCFVDRDAAHSIIEKCDGDGFEFLKLWRADMSKIKPSDLEFTEGEVVYCMPPPGAPTHDSTGRSLVCVVEKPIYGIPQAGRRLQRKVFPWCTDVMGHDSSTTPTVASLYTTTHQATRRSPSVYTLTISKLFTLPSWTTPTGMQLTKIAITLNSCYSFAKIGI